MLNRVGCCILISDEFFPRLRSGHNEEDIILSTAYFYAALAAGIAAVVVFLVLRVKYGGLKGLYSKAIASFFFLLTALCAAADGLAPFDPKQAFPVREAANAALQG